MLSSPLKDGRRVLGEKTPNASFKSLNDKDTATTSPIKLPYDLTTSKIFPSSSHAGQKRSIDQLDSVPEQTTPSKTAARSQREEGFQIFREGTQPAASPKAKTDSSPPITNNPQTTSSDTNAAHPQSIIDPALEAKTGNSTFTFKSTIPIDPEARKLFIQKKAGLLRTRLQSAAKRSNNNSNNNHQIDRRLSALEAHCRTRKPILRRPTVPSASRVIDPNITPKAKAPKLLPAPDLRPTPYSARYNNMPSSPPASTGSENRVETSSNMTTPIQPQQGQPSSNLTTPVQSQQGQQPNTPAQPMQLTSPPGTAETKGNSAINSPESQKEDKEEDDGTVQEMVATSETVNKGEAANGLVKLMKTTGEYDKLDEWTE